MKTKAMIIFVVALLFAITTTAIASNASELFGTIVSYVEQIQEYPAAINDALCEGDREAYQSKMAELADLILAANDAMRDAGLPNTLNLWAVYNAIAANPHCGVHDAALSKADWSREELDRIGYKHGLFDTQSPMCGMFHIGMLLRDVFALRNDICNQGDKCNTVTIVGCSYIPGMNWNGGFMPHWSDGLHH
jgi:hypothetical protein